MTKVWEDKATAYEENYRAGRTAKCIWTYIPAKYCDAIEYAWIDSDGYWVHLNSEYRAYDNGEDCTYIHEYTITDIKEALKTIRRSNNV